MKKLVTCLLFFTYYLTLSQPVEYRVSGESNGILKITDTEIKFNEKNYPIIRKRIVSKFISIYTVKNNNEENEIFIDTSEGVIEHITPLVKNYYYMKSNNNVSGSLGVLGGISSFSTQLSLFSGTYGLWLNFNEWGLEYIESAYLNTEVFDYNNLTSDIITGGYSRNFGFIYKEKWDDGLYSIDGSYLWGFGLQVANTIGVRRNKVFNDLNYIPYCSLGYMGDINENFNFRVSLHISKLSMINIGFGVKIK